MLTICANDLWSRSALKIYAHDLRSRSSTHDLRSRSALTIYGHDLHLRSAPMIYATSLRSHVLTVCGHNLWSLSTVTVCAHYLRSRSDQKAEYNLGVALRSTVTVCAHGLCSSSSIHEVSLALLALYSVYVRTYTSRRPRSTPI